ncbi:hypothetical protein OsI_26835 [Oryza sativa Indica Group]|uniref:Phorbol-ester/DAG-type domain-containing protein n=1 Tax=Oryza sativa subsp. indica TaxID=39946 RepID=A2YNM0_ORYSI|nr:hypothetical protein OsI_26835 [Oryza sativa Indica Group]
MATDGHITHFAHPQHLLLKTRYDSTSRHVCDICRAKLSGLVGYRCNACDFDIHQACADYFKKTISFFAHPWHTLTLCRMPPENKGWVCDLCMEHCPPGNFVYRCIQCKFDVHPLCTLLPQTIRSPLHPHHDLNMVPSSGHCNACPERLPVWHYICGPCTSPSYRLHIGCVSGAPSGVGQGSGGTTNQNNSSSRGQGTGNTSSGANQTTSDARNTTAVVERSRSTSVSKFLLKKSFMIAIDLATGGLASPVLDVLQAVLD